MHHGTRTVQWRSTPSVSSSPEAPLLTTTDYARVIYSGIDSSKEEARLVHELRWHPCPPDLDPCTIDMLLKMCRDCHDLDLAGRVWQCTALLVSDLVDMSLCKNIDHGMR
jgi:hypothetical protein